MNLLTLQVQAMLRLLMVFLSAAGFVFGVLRSFDLTLLILTCRRAFRCIGLGLFALGALAGFGVTLGAAGRLSPPGQARKTWTSLTLRPFSSGGFAQVARTFRLTLPIQLENMSVNTWQHLSNTLVNMLYKEVNNSRRDRNVQAERQQRAVAHQRVVSQVDDFQRGERAEVRQLFQLVALQEETPQRWAQACQGVLGHLK